MARITIPKYRKQKKKNGDLAFVELGGIRHYLGAFGSKDSREVYARKLSEWLATGGRVATDPDQITIIELIAEFWKHAEGYYLNPGGAATSEIECYRQAVKPLVAIYGKTAASGFGPIALKAVRQKMVDTGWCRSYLNHQVARIRRVFKWAASEELIEASVFHRLQVVEGLKRGRTDAPEPAPIEPVSDAVVDATMKHCTPTLRTMIEVQRLCGARPGEICSMRLADLDMSGEIWVYTPQHHKTAYRGRARRIYLGPRVQDLLRPFLLLGGQYLFSPERSDRERREAAHADRKTPLSCGNKPGNRKRSPKRSPGEKYSTHAYGHAIAYACRRAFPAPDGLKGEALRQWISDHRWSPNQLRHSFATQVRREHGLEAAQVLLGHAQANVTQVYAERDERFALETITRIG